MYSCTDPSRGNKPVFTRNYLVLMPNLCDPNSGTNNQANLSFLFLDVEQREIISDN